MFGYISANRKELSPEGLARYKAVYCALCDALKARCGGAYRLMLSYDSVFLALLLSSLYEPERKSYCARCVMHPLKPCAREADGFTEYAADMTVALFYHKCLDDWRDEHKKSRKLLYEKLAGPYKNVSARYPSQCGMIEASLSRLYALEAERSADTDALATAFGETLSAVFSPYDDMWTPTLRAFGTELGRFIYITDAWDDIARDMKKGAFNPLAEQYRAAPKNFDEECRAIMTLLIGRAAAAFEKLPLVEDIEIMRNVLYSGVWTRFYMKTRLPARAGNEGRRDDAGDRPV